MFFHVFNLYENIVKMQNIISYIYFDFEYKYNPSPDCSFHETKIQLFSAFDILYRFSFILFATFSPYIPPWIEILIIHQKLKMYDLLIWASSPISQSHQRMEAKHNESILQVYF